MQKVVKCPLVDPMGVQDVYISGVASIESLDDGNCVRVTLYVERNSPYDGTHERHVVASLVMSADTLDRCNRQTRGVIDGTAEPVPRTGDEAVH